MKTNDQNVETKSTNNYRGIGAGLLVLLMAVSFSVHTYATKSDVNLAQECYEFVGADLPSDILVRDITLYSSAQTSLNCPEEIRTFCGFCFESGDFPVDATGIPILWDALLGEPTALGQVVIDNRATLSDPVKIVEAENGNMVTLHYRKFK